MANGSGDGVVFFINGCSVVELTYLFWEELGWYITDCISKATRSQEIDEIIESKTSMNLWNVRVEDYIGGLDVNGKRRRVWGRNDPSRG